MVLSPNPYVLSPREHTRSQETRVGPPDTVQGVDVAKRTPLEVCKIGPLSRTSSGCVKD